MKFINLVGASGVGKSTVINLLTGMLCTAGYATAQVPEFAKAMTWRRDQAALRNPLFMFAQQEAQLEVLRDRNLDFVVVDGCLLNALVYPVPRMLPSFEPMVIEYFNDYDNVNFFIEGVAPFSSEGRNETKEQSDEVAQWLLQLMERHGITYHKKMPGDIFAAGEIFTILTGHTPPFVPVESRRIAVAQ